jgi:DNA-binding NtrC family response regulator
MATPLRALIVEDSEDDCMLLLSILQRGGYSVEHKRVDTAVSLKATLDDPWDIIISDFSMPGFRGTDALSIVRDRGLDMPFIFLSCTIGEDMAVSAMKAGAQDYVIKGNVARLLPAIERELREAETRRDKNRSSIGCASSKSSKRSANLRAASRMTSTM